MRIFEINTWVWLTELSERYGRTLTLETVPDAEWDALVPFHFDAVWLMGVWQRSPQARAIARADPTLRANCRAVMPGLKDEDILASPYAIHSYVVEERLGGPAGLATARAQLAKRHLQLILDFVPNHSAPDHLWTFLHPEYYVQGTSHELRSEPGRFLLSDADVVIARGAVSRRGAPVWADTAQLDAFSPGYREAALLTVLDLASQCDGVRCDMAMLLLNGVFSANWPSGTVPTSEFWEHLIGEVRRRYPSFKFIAESYSDSEWVLQQQGFDYCYDKDRLYERLAHGNAEALRQHLRFSAPDYLARLIHFLENHDEMPAVDKFRPSGRHQVAAIAMATLPGASLWYDRQFEGRWGHLPVQLGRAASIAEFYRRILQATARPEIRGGAWAFCPIEPEASLLGWTWTLGERRTLVVINFSDHEAWGRVKLPWPGLRGESVTLLDSISEETFGPRDGAEILEHGLVVGLPGWGFHLFEVRLHQDV